MNKRHEFSRYMTAILNGYEAMRDDTDPRVKEVRINHARWAFKKCTAMFNDKRENLRRWLDGEPCVFVSPVTGALIEIEIGEDFDAMFHFLEFCRKQNNREPIDDDFCDYLALLITKSQRRCCEEC